MYNMYNIMYNNHDDDDDDDDDDDNNNNNILYDNNYNAVNSQDWHLVSAYTTLCKSSSSQQRPVMCFTTNLVTI
jgi:hypothetical protein